MARATATSLIELTQRALAGAGANASMARLTAEALVAAQMQGVASHGLTRLEIYLAHLRNGRANGQAQPTVVKRSGAAVLIDAHAGLAYPACHLAMASAIEMAAQQGVAVAAVANSHHFGAAGLHLLPAAQAGMIALALGNSPAAMPAWGGKRALLGTNPLAAIFPRETGDPLLIDLSLSAAARGKLVQAARAGERIPQGWALDAQGQPTTDPQAGLDGTLLPAGGLKGALLALIIELLAAALTGSHFGFEADSFLTEQGEAPRVGQTFLVIDPAAFAGRQTYLSRVDVLVSAMLEEPEVRLPGANRFAHQRTALAEGVPVDDRLLQQLQGWAHPDPDPAARV